MAEPITPAPLRNEERAAIRSGRPIADNWHWTGLTLLEALEAAEERAAEMVPKDWHGLSSILDEIYPEATFPTLASDDRHRDLGPRIISLTRHLLAAEQRARDMEDQLQEARLLLTGWEEQAGIDDASIPHNSRLVAARLTGMRDATRECVSDLRAVLETGRPPTGGHDG